MFFLTIAAEKQPIYMWFESLTSGLQSSCALYDRSNDSDVAIWADLKAFAF